MTVETIEEDDPLVPFVREEAAFAEVNDPVVVRLIESLSRAAGVSELTAADGFPQFESVLSRLMDSSNTQWDGATAFSAPVAAGELGRLGHFRVLIPLGAGGMGSVYLARQEHPDRLVALKIFTGGVRLRPQDLVRFRLEARALALLAHPNIVPIFEAGDIDGLPFIAMEYASGGSLAGKLAHAPLAARPAAELLALVARAIGHAHAMCLLHRDLKPSNILLVAGIPKVADFGLAKELKSENPANATRTGALLGTPSYMAPELAAGAANASPATEIYGLGAVLYECLTGRPPFRASTVLETLDQVRTQEPAAPSRLQSAIPRDLETICLKCLEKEPSRRYGTAEELADDLDRFLRGEPVRARPAGPMLRLVKWSRRRPAFATLLAISAAALMALVAVTTVYTSRLRDAKEQSDRNASEARQRQAEATHNYREARAALRRMIARLERYPAHLPRVSELREEQLRDAVRYLETALAGFDDPDPEVRLDAALGCIELGTSQYLLGRRDSARDNFLRALALIEQLPEELRSQPDTRYGLIQCFNHLANLTRDPGQGTEYFVKALRAVESLVAEDPNDTRRQNTLAKEEHTFGTHLYAEKRSGEAIPHYRRAMEIREALIQRHQDVAEYRSDLGEDCINLGLIQLQANRFAEADRLFQKGEGLLKPLVDREPVHDRYALSLAGIYVNWGLSRRFQSDAAGAFEKFERAIELADRVLAREPQLADARQRSAEAHGTRAELLIQVGREKETVADWQRVLDGLAPNGQRYRIAFASALLKAGDPGRAAVEIRKAAAVRELNGTDRFNLACVLTLLGEALQAPPAGILCLSVEQEINRRTAVKVLQDLADAGYFRDPEKRRFLDTDTDLAPLRSRPDFQRLIIGLLK